METTTAKRPVGRPSGSSNLHNKYLYSQKDGPIKFAKSLKEIGNLCGCSEGYARHIYKGMYPGNRKEIKIVKIDKSLFKE